MSMIKSG